MATSRSAADTERAGAELARELRPGDIVLVAGELGAGKTTFVRGALRALGVTEPVTSPTFVLGALYEGAAGPCAHLDLYRLDGLDGEDPGLLDPYFAPDTITFVEWPERGKPPGGPPPASGAGGPGRVSVCDRLRHPWAGRAVARRVTLRHAGGDRREVEVRDG